MNNKQRQKNVIQYIELKFQMKDAIILANMKNFNIFISEMCKY